MKEKRSPYPCGHTVGLSVSSPDGANPCYACWFDKLTDEERERMPSPARMDWIVPYPEFDYRANREW
jgi:hypothetical protein